MTVTDKGNYAIIDTGKEQYSIAKKSVIITQSSDSVLIRLNGSRRVLVNIPSANAADLAQELITKLY